MRKPVLTIFYQFNPWHPSKGGIQTIIQYFIKYVPSSFEVRLVGTGVDASKPHGEWEDREFEGRPLKFFPLITVEDDDTRKIVPTSLRYTWALRRHNFASDFMHFHRIEPALSAQNWQGEKTLFIQNDVEEQISGKDGKNAILWQWFPWAYFGLERLLMNQFSEILSCNSNACEFYKREYPAISEHVQYYQVSVDTNRFFPLATPQKAIAKQTLCEQLELSKETQFLLFVGRLHPQKDPVLLVQSMAALAQENVHLLVVGDGELRPAVESEIEKLGLTKKVTMLGSKSLEELVPLYQVASALVLTSVYEGQPVTVLEAMACGTPIVTTRCGDTPSLLSPQTGIVVDQRTPKDIASAFSAVLAFDEDVTREACLKVAMASSAETVITSIYDQMFERWKQQNNELAALQV